MSVPALEPGYFDRLYADNPDPWGFDGNPYEMAKYAATIAALPRARYRNALEVGCSIGFLTKHLSNRCNHLLGTDVAELALVAAIKRCSLRPNVSFALSNLPDLAPTGPFDLIVLSEVLYYFDAMGLEIMAQSLDAQIMSECDMVLVHWLGPTPDYPLTGDGAVTRFLELVAPHSLIMSERTQNYRLDIIRFDIAR
jgi:SAM-dependent methyltransferase